jgi:hypothetical protein
LKCNGNFPLSQNSTEGQKFKAYLIVEKAEDHGDEKTLKKNKSFCIPKDRTAGLPDFSWYKIPKGEKINAPNDHKMYQRTIKCTK